MPLVMAKVFDQITEDLQRFISSQQMFFVATAPLSASGHINVSPKGLDSFRVVSPHRVAYHDLTGSGNETSAHLLENGRITLMFCAFQGAPLILRLFGQGSVIAPNTPEWESIYPLFSAIPGTRQIVLVEVERVQTSCGTGVPLYNFVGQRDELVTWAEKKGAQGLQDYWRQKNQVSIDGLQTPLAQRLNGQYTEKPDFNK